MEWINTINDAIDYIEQNLTLNLTVEDISARYNVSRFHFQRIFGAITGVTISEYMRNRRLSLAAEELMASHTKVIDVAYKYGYETPESFTKAFQRFHGISPIRVKKAGVSLKSFQPLSINLERKGGTLIDYRILKKDGFDLCILSEAFHLDSSEAEIPAFWEKYFSMGRHNIVPAEVGLCSQIKASNNEFVYGIGCKNSKLKVCPPGFEVFPVPAATWAIFQCVGAMPMEMQTMWKRIYMEWLPQSVYDLIYDFDMEYYKPGNMQSKDYVSEIWLPVKSKYETNRHL